ncbi:MAG: hypothetical protein IT431_02115 [Phycisphaerales bacterium]|nr:hypothetical protein [Phycisphaerales bacterium]
MDRYAKTLVLIARLSGLGLFIYTAIGAQGFVAELWGLQFNPQLSLSMVLGYLVVAAPWLVLLALSLHLVLGGRWLIARMLRGLDGSCPACGHALPERGRRCPECGYRFATRPGGDSETGA